ncbi:g7706 [Coccomyxa viridis]|uniref:Fatty acyl-CoA reductase n=1 Tax=Coccomyxa viridis TaxID=1274662 RepID=A0ABP1G552_9CHLO
MSVATLRHQVSCPSDFMRTTTVIPLEVSTSEGPAAHHTILADPILRSGRPINTARIAEKTPKVPRTPKTPAKVPAPPTHYESGGQMWPIPACSLDSHHCSQLGHGRLSVKAAFSGATVFITGASGYVGSVVLEQLLRFAPDVARIYMLIRGKRGVTGEQRLDNLLKRDLFCKLRDGDEFPEELRRKLVVMGGDLGLPGLGLSEEDRQTLTREVHYIVHSAASISFVDHIHNLISHNYIATKNMAALAADMRQLRSFLHVSTAYVNCFLGRQKHVEERQYPIMFNGKPMNHAAVIEELQDLPPKEAESRAADYLRLTGHVNTYTFTKMLTEMAIGEHHNSSFPVAIVRPSIVGSIARHPFPGYFGNSAGTTAYFLAYGSGICTMTCHKAHNVFDVVPGDVVGSVILTTAAATVQNKWADRSRPLVVHACSSTTYPYSHYNIYRDSVYPFYQQNPCKLRFTLGSYVRHDKQGGMDSFYVDHESWAFAIRKWLGGAKFYLIRSLMNALGYTSLAKKVWAGWQAWNTYNTPKLDFQLFFCCNNARAMTQLQTPEEAKQMPLTWDIKQDSNTAYFATHLKYMTTYFFGSKKTA